MSVSDGHFIPSYRLVDRYTFVDAQRSSENELLRGRGGRGSFLVLSDPSPRALGPSA